MEIFAPGTQIILHSNLQAVVLSVEITSRTAAMYQVAWWDGRTRMTAWVKSSEIFSGDSEKLQIGFRQ